MVYVAHSLLTAFAHHVGNPVKLHVNTEGVIGCVEYPANRAW